MPEVWRRLRDILGEQLSDTEAEALIAELFDASRDGTVEIRGDASGNIIVTGNENTLEIRQEVESKELYREIYGFLQKNAANQKELKLSLEEIRALIQEVKNLQTSQYKFHGIEENTHDLSSHRIELAPSTVARINERLEIIQELQEIGYLPASRQKELRNLKRDLQKLSDLKDNLAQITKRSDRLIQSAVETMQLQLDSLSLSGQKLIDGIRDHDLKCQQKEVKAVSRFVDSLEISRAAADWIGKSETTQKLVDYAYREMRKVFPELDASEKEIDDFKFSLKQFVEQIRFSLHWGTCEILDAPQIPLIFEVEHYEAAFESMNQFIPKRLGNAKISAIQECIDYVLERLHTY